jgi:hypothetical protein
MRMQLAHGLEDGLCARMIGGREQGLDDRETLRGHGESAIAAAFGKMRHALAGIGAAPVIVNDLQFHAD